MNESKLSVIHSTRPISNFWWERVAWVKTWNPTKITLAGINLRA